MSSLFFLYCSFQASESPGGLEADQTDPDFPTAMEASTTTIDTTPGSYDDLDLSSFTETNVTSIDTNVTDTLTTITASDPKNWRGSTWDEKHDIDN